VCMSPFVGVGVGEVAHSICFLLTSLK